MRFQRIILTLRKGQYLHDYEELLAKDLESIYHVKDSWENYYKLKSRIDERFREWKTPRKHGVKTYFSKLFSKNL